MDSFDILVIILSITLLILLVVMIAVGIAAYKLVQKLQSITAVAENIADDVETASSFFKKSAGPIALTGFVSNIVKSVMKHNKGKKGKK